ncbi:MAG: DUF4349 domain-containing protein [Clostridia bacterium]|nr:DUF4349 domain-containing protein [Clostridia bacterium]
MKKWIAILLTVLLLFALVGCGTSNYEASDGGLKNDSSASNVADGNDLTERKIIRRITMEMETRNFGETLEKLNSAITAVSGYTETVNEYSRSGYRRATYVIRVPSTNLNGFLTSVSDIGNVLSRSESIEDVTLAYVDTESRIKALKTEETALIEMMEKAETLNDILEIRSRLTEVQYQLDSYESQLRKYDNLIDYSTVTVYISEVERLANIRGGVWGQIGDDFMDNLYAIGDAAVAFFIWFVGSLPILILLGGVATGGFFLYRHVRRKRKAIQAAKKASDATE